MNKTTVRKVIVAFIAGQIAQLVCHGVCFNYWDQYQIPFCIAGGFLITFAVCAGVWIAKHSVEPEKTKTYLDWAKIPGERNVK